MSDYCQVYKCEHARFADWNGKSYCSNHLKGIIENAKVPERKPYEETTKKVINKFNHSNHFTEEDNTICESCSA